MGAGWQPAFRAPLMPGSQVHPALLYPTPHSRELFPSVSTHHPAEICAGFSPNEAEAAGVVPGSLQGNGKVPAPEGRGFGQRLWLRAPGGTRWWPGRAAPSWGLVLPCGVLCRAMLCHAMSCHAVPLPCRAAPRCMPLMARRSALHLGQVPGAPRTTRAEDASWASRPSPHFRAASGSPVSTVTAWLCRAAVVGAEPLASAVLPH